MLTCEQCGSDDLDLVERLADGRRRVGCQACGHQWVRGEATAPRPVVNSFEETRRRFPGPDQVDPDRLARVNALKAEFLAGHPDPQSEVGPYWARYQQVFSQEGLSGCDPQDLKDFANSDVGARPGNMSMFNSAWNDMGATEAAARTRATISYLLYGPEHVPMEDRLTHLIQEHKGLGMPGFKESLLTKVLCIAQPERFLPILTYSSAAGGKRQIAKWVYGLDLPEEARAQWTIGRLILWSNDVLLQLAGDGVAHTQHMSQFLWQTKDRQTELA